MPIYEYECPKCGARFELCRSMVNSDRDVKCPGCGAEKTRRIFSAPAITSGGSCVPSSPT